MIPTVQNISIQHKIFSRYFVGWNSPKYGKHIPIAPATLFILQNIFNFRIESNRSNGKQLDFFLLPLTRIRWRNERAWINSSIVPRMIRDHKIHQAIVWRSARFYVLLYPLNIPKSNCQPAFLLTEIKKIHTTIIKIKYLSFHQNFFQKQKKNVQK